MGTKNNPGNYDCYKNLDPNEPYFLLKSTDPSAPHLVRVWAMLRKGLVVDQDQAICNSIAEAKRDLRDRKKSFNQDKYDEAIECAEAMEEWAAESPRECDYKIYLGDRLVTTFIGDRRKANAVCEGIFGALTLCGFGHACTLQVYRNGAHDFACSSDRWVSPGTPTEKLKERR